MSYALHLGDCLEVMKGIPDGSVDAVIFDPPYGTMKGAERTNKYGSRANPKHEWDETIDTAAMFAECNRVLRTNGALLLFSQEPYTSHLITNTHSNLPFSYRFAWLKDNFAFALCAKKAPVNYTEDICVFFKLHPSRNTHPLAEVVREAQERSGKFWNGELAEVYVRNGWSKSIVNAKAVLKHSLNWNYVQFGAPSAQQYERLKDLIPLPSFEEMQRADQEHRGKNPRAFNLPEGKKFKPNVLQYKKDYTGQHPTQKPVLLMEDLVHTYTNPGDLVLDFTMGSGSTGVAAGNLGRRFIGIEMDQGYFDIARSRVSVAYKETEESVA